MNRYLPENYRFADKKFDCDRKRVKCVTRFCRPIIIIIVLAVGFALRATPRLRGWMGCVNAGS